MLPYIVTMVNEECTSEYGNHVCMRTEYKTVSDKDTYTYTYVLRTAIYTMQNVRVQKTR